MIESCGFASTYAKREEKKHRNVDAIMAVSFGFASTYAKREDKKQKDVDARIYESRIPASKPAVPVIRWEPGTDSGNY